MKPLKGSLPIYDTGVIYNENAKERKCYIRFQYYTKMYLQSCKYC